MLFYRPFADQTTAGNTITNIYNLLSGNVPYSATDTNTYKLNDSISTLDGVDYVGSNEVVEVNYQAPLTKFQPRGAVIPGPNSNTYSYTTQFLTDNKKGKASWGLKVVGNKTSSARIKFNDDLDIYNGSSFNVNGKEKIIAGAMVNGEWLMNISETTVAGTSVFMRNYVLPTNIREANTLKIGGSSLIVGDKILFGKTYLYSVTSITANPGTNPQQYTIVLSKQTPSQSKVYLIGSKKYYYNGSVFVEDYLTREKVKSKVSPPTAQVLDQEQ
jgi:hypothetical protein